MSFIVVLKWKPIICSEIPRNVPTSDPLQKLKNEQGILFPIFCNFLGEC